MAADGSIKPHSSPSVDYTVEYFFGSGKQGCESGLG